MLNEPIAERKSPRTKYFAISLAVHSLVLGVLLHPPKPRFLTPLSVMSGSHGQATELVYFSRAGIEDSGESKPAAQKKVKLLRPKRLKKNPLPQPAEALVIGATQENPDTTSQRAATRAGSELGTSLDGPAFGHDIRPALPVEGGSPVVAADELPSGIEGNVIVEVTIDANGNVTQTKLLQGIGHGIDEKVIAALGKWHFTPATQDGRPIPSQQDCYFHFGGRRS